MASCLQTLTNPLRRYLYVPGDSEQQVKAKLIWMCTQVMMHLQLMTASWSSASKGLTEPMFLQLFNLMVMIWPVMYFLYTRVLTDWFIMVSAVIMCMAIVLSDLGYMALLFRTWPWFIVVIDVLLLIEASQQIINFCVVSCVLWLCLSQAEYAFRFGMLDLPMTPAYEDRFERVDCTKPPCRNPWGAISGFAFAVGLFVFDYLVTSGFHRQMKCEKENVQKSVDAAKHVAACLASFDLLSAAEYLDSYRGTLPAELTTSFEQLLSNLATYKPFLPREFFTDDGEMSHAPTLNTEVGIPGHLSRENAIVFTGIYQSGALWEHCPDAMHDALQIHNRIIRGLVVDVDGYEVKTIGDSFMLAFHTARDAVRFGLDLQRDLNLPNVLPDSLVRPNAGDGLGALCLRVGVDYGECVVEKNVLTGRYEYFGNAVSRALQAENYGAAMAVTVTEEVMHEVAADELPVPWIALRYRCARHVRGLDQPLQLSALLGVEMAGCAVQVRTISDLQPNADGPLGWGLRSPTEDSCASSEASASTPIAAGPPPPAPLATSLMKINVTVTASVAVVKYDFPVTNSPLHCEKAVRRASQRLEHIHAHLSETGGFLSSVVGSIALTSWGVHQPCRQHVNESARFLLKLCHSLGETTFAAGLSTGLVRSAPVSATSSQRFVTYVGWCVDIAFALCTAALELNTTALAASAGSSNGQHDTNSMLKLYLRPVDVWSCGVVSDKFVANTLWQDQPTDIFDEQETMTVYEVDVQALKQISTTKRGGRSPTANESTSAETRAALGKYWHAFQTRDIAFMRQLGKSDRTARIVADMMNRGMHLPHAMVTMRDETSRLARDLDQDVCRAGSMST